MLEIDGRILVDGEEAGTTDGFYLLALEPESPSAFDDFWDMEQWTCDVHAELRVPGGDRFREPLPRLLSRASGILFIRLVALAPRFRGRSIGAEALRHWLDRWCDSEIGAVLIHAQPLQHRPGAYDLHDDEIRDLPWEGAEADGERLARHLRRWGFHAVAGTRFMVASPAALGVEQAEDDEEPFGRFASDDDLPF